MLFGAAFLVEKIMDIKLKVVIQDSHTQKHYDITQLVSEIHIQSWIAGQAGMMTFAFIQSKKFPVHFYEGSKVYVQDISWEKPKGIFWGYVFTKSRGKDGIITVTAYDQLRYLKNRDIYKFEGKTSSQIFEKICKDFLLNHETVDKSPHVLERRLHDNKPLSAILEDALAETLVISSQKDKPEEVKRYVIRDDFGILKHVDIRNLDSGVTIGDKQKDCSLLLSDYDYRSSIDENTYNTVKFVNETGDGDRRDRYDSDETMAADKIGKWGMLQYFEQVSVDLKSPAIKEKARRILELYGDVKRTLSFGCVGDFRVFAGASVWLNIENLGDISVNQRCIVTKCEHDIKSNLHTMKLEVEVPWTDKKQEK